MLHRQVDVEEASESDMDIDAVGADHPYLADRQHDSQSTDGSEYLPSEEDDEEEVDLLPEVAIEYAEKAGVCRHISKPLGDQGPLPDLDMYQDPPAQKSSAHSTPPNAATLHRPKPSPVPKRQGQPSSDSKEGWHRSADNGFLLDGEDAVRFKPPSTKPNPPQLKSRLSSQDHFILDIAFGRLIVKWPAEDSSDYLVWMYSSTSADLFWIICLRPVLMDMKAEWAAKTMGKTPYFSDQVGEALGPFLTKVSSASISLSTPFLQSVLNSFQSHVERISQPSDPPEQPKAWPKYEPDIQQFTSIPPSVAAAQTAAGKVVHILNNSYIKGKSAVKSAVWVPVQKRRDPEFLHKYGGKNTMFYEDAHLYKEALGMGKTNIALIDDTWHRVVAPIKQTEPCALVLWEPDSDHDTTQTWGKVVAWIIYNLESAYKSFEECDVNADTVISVRSKGNLARGVESGGLMVKSLAGTHETRGSIVRPTLKVEKAKTHTKEAINKEKKQRQLRVELFKRRPVSQSLLYEIMRGFHPKWAEDIKDTAEKCGLVNVLGRPEMSFFATFGYCSGSHLDNDATVSIARVSHRDKKYTSRRESNFFLANYGVIIELEKGAFWSWRAKSDHHGTTMNAVATRFADDFKAFAKEFPRIAQWTEAAVIPKKLVDAARGLVEVKNDMH